MKCPKCGHTWKDEGRVKGGKMSKRVLTKEQAQAMVEARENKRLILAALKEADNEK